MEGRRKGRDFIARHGETVYNRAKRMQGDHPHTPLTRAGFAQADEMGATLRELLGARPRLTLWSSSAGRALQTLAVIAEHLELDWHEARRRFEVIGVLAKSPERSRRDAEMAAETLAVANNGDVLLVKASLGLGLSTVVAELIG